MGEFLNAIDQGAPFEDLQLFMTKEESWKEKDAQGKSSIHHAVMIGNQGLAEQILIQHPELVNALDNNHTTPVVLATQAGNLDMLSLLLQVENVNPNIPELAAHHTALHYAAGAVNLQAVESLLNVRADLAAATVTGLQVMHMVVSAIADGNKKGWDLVSWLYSHGANVDPETTSGETPESMLNGVDQSYGDYYYELTHFPE